MSKNFQIGLPSFSSTNFFVDALKSVVVTCSQSNNVLMLLENKEYMTQLYRPQLIRGPSNIMVVPP